MKPSADALAHTRLRRALLLGAFATLATLVLLGFFLFGNQLLDRLSDGRRAATINLVLWVIILTACCAIGNALAGKSVNRRRAWTGIVLGVLPFLLLGQHIAVHGPRHPAPSFMQALRDRGGNLVADPAFTATPGALTALAPDEPWCLIPGPPTNALPVLISPNLRTNLSSLAELRGPVFRSLDATHPLGTDWLVAVYPGGRTRLVEAATASWEDVLPPLPVPENRPILRP